MRGDRISIEMDGVTCTVHEISLFSFAVPHNHCVDVDNARIIVFCGNTPRPMHTQGYARPVPERALLSPLCRLAPWLAWMVGEKRLVA
jgi:hypothetical protein